jgi:hypothetical protein
MCEARFPGFISSRHVTKNTMMHVLRTEQKREPGSMRQWEGHLEIGTHAL